MTPEEGVSPEGELMVYKDMFTVLVVDSCIERSPSLRDAGMPIVVPLREDHHLRTDVLGSTKDAIMRLRHDASVACLLLEWGGKTGGIDAKRVLDTVADVGLEIPVFLLAPAENLAREQAGLLRDEVRGLIYPEEDAPDFVARYVNRHFEAYIERLKTPFFGRIIEFNESSSEMWTCPAPHGPARVRGGPAAGLRQRAAARPVPAHARLLPQGPDLAAAAAAVPGRAPSRDRAVAAGGHAAVHRRPGRLRADRRGERPDSGHDCAGVPAGHRRDGARRTLGRPRGADDRLPQAVPGQLRPLPRVRERDPGRLPRTGQGRPGAAVHLRHP